MIKLDAARVKADLGQVAKAMKAARAEILGQETMTNLAENAVTIIQQRTGESSDVAGGGFAPYTEAYARRKAKSGRSTTPNLSWSGRMLQNMTSKFISPGKAAIIFTRAEEAVKAAANHARRPFLGIEEPRHLAALSGHLDRLVDKAIKRMGLA